MKHNAANQIFYHKLQLMLLKLVHFLGSIALFAGAWFLFRYNSIPVASTVGFRYNYLIIFAYGAILFFFCRTYNAYLVGFARIRALIFGQLLAQFFTVTIVYFAVSIAWNRFHSPAVLALLLIPQFVLNVLWSYVANLAYFKIIPTKNTILIYRNLLDRKRFGSLRGKPCERIYKITAELQYDGSFEDLVGYLDGFDAVFIAGVNSRCRNGILKYCKDRRLDAFMLPHVGDVIMQEAKHIQSFSSPVLNVGRTVLNPEYAFIKRAFDIVSSGLAIVILSPLMLITALAIKLYDGGPALYKQIRLTKDEREFRILKFRSMRVDAEKDGVARLSTGDQDDRITPIGRIIRKCRLDELPQLFNIFAGDMSVVGPRPERPEIMELYRQSIPDFHLRLQVKAGLTGYAQVYGKYNTEPYEKLQFDLLYINHMSVLTDLRLIFSTIPILFLNDSTEGIAEGQTTAIDYENCVDHSEEEYEAVAK